MAYVSALLNKAAIEKFGAAKKVRVKSRDGVLLVRPTDRTSEINLPKGERLRDLKTKGGKTMFSVKEDFLEPGASLLVQAEKYGWYALVPGTPEGRSAPVVKLAAAVE